MTIKHIDQMTKLELVETILAIYLPTEWVYWETFKTTRKGVARHILQKIAERERIIKNK